MSEAFEKVKGYLQELELPISSEDENEELVIVNDEESGLNNLIIDCEDPILILEQAIIPIPDNPGNLYKRLLEINRTLIHGAFAIDEETNTVLFRDTLNLETLDRAELEGSINALGLALAENAGELLEAVR
ncbi:TPA: molecular chaperone Tir [Candidatus Latescibacteria bacterium]|nr:molecular chaperone Tir [Candidatus Latescibacterota bacterium]|tara:strand:- start:431 stop:823 length:393 start_codon:yes stop_codon:yes gene_type:complete